MRGALVVVICAACGRVSFDPLRDAGPGDGDARDAATASDATSAACDLGAPFGAPVLISELSTLADNEATLRLRADELAGVYWSSANGQVEVFEVTRPDRTSPFSVAPIAALSSAAIDLDPGISGDGTIIVFSSNRPGSASFDLHEATRVGTTFTIPVRPAALMSAGDDQHPNFVGTTAEMYFSSTLAGPRRLFRTTRTGPAQYSTPIPITEIADGDEADPTPSADGLSIYWASNRAGGPGEFDIYVATRTSTALPFGPATLVPNLSTTAYDGPNWLSPDGCRLYLSSSILGTPDIYVATRP